MYSDGATVVGKTDYAEVVRVKLPANASIPSHQGGDRVILSLDDYSISFAKTGEVDNVRFEKGTVHFHPAGIHKISNTGSNTAEFVVFERLSGAALPEGEPTADEDDTPTPDTGATEEKSLSNDAFDVYKVAIAPGGKLAPHKGFARAVYSLDDYKIDFHEDGQTKTRTFAAGEVHFHEPGNHWLKNAGETPADFVVVDYKR